MRGCAETIAATALPAAGLAAERDADKALPTRPIPSSGERLPVIGLGTNAYGVTDPADLASRQAVVARLLELDARVIDTARAYGDSELVIASSSRPRPRSTARSRTRPRSSPRLSAGSAPTPWTCCRSTTCTEWRS